MRRKTGLLLAIAWAATVAFGAGGESGDWELGLYGGYGFPDDYETLEPDDDLLYGVRFGYFFTPLVSLEGSLQRFSSETMLPASAGLPDGDFEIDSARANVLWNFRAGKPFRPFLTGGLGLEMHDVGDLFDEDEASANAGGGLRWLLGERFGIRLDGRWVYVDADEAQNNLEATFGILWAFGGGPPPDADGDGVPDRRDKCPDTPRGATVDAAGCPSDGDGDGVYDGIDQCPDTPKGAQVDARGCPKDSDGDGVYDGLDQCPSTPKGATVDAKGCPSDADGDGVHDGIDQCPNTPKGAGVDAKGCPKDTDGDGVGDGLDQCPNTPKGATVDAKGCPEDTDGDGVYDGIDKCPQTDRGVKVDADGCTVLFEAGQTTLVLEGVTFALNSAELTGDAKTILDRVASVLKERADVRVEIGGHTDSSGSADHNRNLSQRRAESVRDYLVGRGVPAARLEAKGYGEDKPIADNKTDAGRAQNRRVALSRIE